MAKHNKINHEQNIGKKINRLTILDLYKKGKDFYYRCQCDCGTIKDIRSWYVTTGVIKSCGCLLHEKRVEYGSIMGKKNRKYTECSYCHSKNHYAKGLCRNCYSRFIRNGKADYINNVKGNKQ